MVIGHNILDKIIIKLVLTWIYWENLVLFFISSILQENPEFDLHFEKVYRWVASSTAEKNSFISCIWKLNQRYLRKKVEFVNVSPQLLEGMAHYCSWWSGEIIACC